MMTREAKVGVMMVAVLIGVFGFLMYKRVHQPNEGLAMQSTDDRQVSSPRDEFLSDQPETLTLNPPRRLDDLERFNERENSFAEEAPQELTPPPRRERQRDRAEWSQASVASSDDDFGQFEAPQKATKPVVHKPRHTEPSTNAFDDFPAEKPAVRTIGFANEEENTDPFDEPPTVISSRSDELEMEESPKAENTHHRHPAQERERERPQPTFEPRESRNDFDVAAPVEAARRNHDFESPSELSPRERKRAAPINLPDEEPRMPAAELAPRIVHGHTYTIQPNDSFWSISRKRYGAGRYYMALALHNQQTIPDPKMMKPGTVISTPETSFLELHYPQSIPKTATTASPQPTGVIMAKSQNSPDTEQSGFFVSPDGVPMYRIGKSDTLSEIAKSHLGRTSRWVQILEMNRNVLRDGNDLKIGTVIRLPNDASRVRMAGLTEEAR